MGVVVRKLHIYLAAPFFNKAEIDVVSNLEELILHEYGHKFTLFSPRQQHFGRKPDLKSLQVRNQIFTRNLQELKGCDVILAWLDRKQMHPQNTVRIVRPHVYDTTVRDGQSYEACSNPLHQPDLGTVWELGYLSAIKERGLAHPIGTELPVRIGFSLRDPHNDHLNVMITQCLEAVIFGWIALKDFLDLPTPREWYDFFISNPWKGNAE